MKKHSKSIYEINDESLWSEMEEYLKSDFKRKVFDYGNLTVQLYMGAMSIPLLALQPKNRVIIDQTVLNELSEILRRYKLELEYVEENNYKINREDTKAYVGRLTDESFKLSIKRLIDEIGSKDLFRELFEFYIRAITP
jgi:hypothetical protein